MHGTVWKLARGLTGQLEKNRGCGEIRALFWGRSVSVLQDIHFKTPPVELESGADVADAGASVSTTGLGVGADTGDSVADTGASVGAGTGASVAPASYQVDGNWQIRLGWKGENALNSHLVLCPL